MGLNGFIFEKVDENKNIKMKKKILGWIGCAKGQIKSEWTYEIVNFPKIDP